MSWHNDERGHVDRPNLLMHYLVRLRDEVRDHRPGESDNTEAVDAVLADLEDEVGKMRAELREARKGAA